MYTNKCPSDCELSMTLLDVLQPSLRVSLALQTLLDMLSVLTSPTREAPKTAQSMGYSLHALVSGAPLWTVELAWHSTFLTGSRHLHMLRTTVVAPLASVRKYCMREERQIMLHQNMSKAHAERCC